MRAVRAASILVVVAACNPGPRPPVRSSPEIDVTRSESGGTGEVFVVGLPAHDIATLRERSFSLDEWNALLRVTVDGDTVGSDLPAVAGAYSVADSVLRFVPLFPLDPALAHLIVFDPTHLPLSPDGARELWRLAPIERVIDPTAQPRPPTTRVTQVFPHDVLLENQLRIYIHFSAPMGHGRANDYVRLLIGDGEVVEDAFLPLDISLWNADRTRFTLLFDPGRIKRGILPNEELGRPLEAGKRYAFVVDREWRDAQNVPLVADFRHEFDVVAGVYEPIVPAAWRLNEPVAGTRDPLTVTFARALDHAILGKALMVVEATGRIVDGTITIADSSRQWTFTPDNNWTAGKYHLGALSILEDPAGNRIGRAFDVDLGQPESPGERRDDTRAQALVPFTVTASPSPRKP